MHVASENIIAMRCPIPRGNRKFLSTNLSIFLHLILFSLPFVISYYFSKPKIKEEMSVELISIAAPNIDGRFDKANEVIEVEKSEDNPKKKQKPEEVKILEKTEEKNEPQIEIMEKMSEFPSIDKVKPLIKEKELLQKPKQVEQEVKVENQVKPAPKFLRAKKQATSNDKGDKASTIVQTLKEGDFIRTTPPIYPKRAIETGMQGMVLIKALINNDGKAEKVFVAKSSGYIILDNSAVQAVSKWYFKPKHLGVNFPKTWVKVPVRFVLQ
jgi:protein TonB